MSPSATNGANGTSKIDFTSFSNIINGKLSPTSKTRTGINPSTKQENWPVPVSTPEDLDAAVEAGRAAFLKWSRVSVPERREKILAFAEALKAYTADFAKLLTTEQGKPVSAPLHHYS
jgi:acyl-CoA reductase-like NAD-dependent aldehyde dehydrogenase